MRPHPYDNPVLEFSDKGELRPANPPKGPKDRSNFLVTWQGKDWSGFLTFDKAEETMESLARQRSPESLHYYTVVERI